MPGKRLITLVSIPLALISVRGQDYQAFGKPDLRELQMKECSFEKGAAAMKLLDIQETSVTIGNDIKVEVNRRVRVKIFSKAGFDASNIIIPYTRKNSKSKITDITAYIYNLDSNGRIVITKLDKTQIFKDKAKKGLNTTAFTFPNVKPGSVIEYRYSHTQKGSLHLEPWFFQDRIPTALSECKFKHPSAFKIDYRFVTMDSVHESSKTDHIYKHLVFRMKNIHAFRPEPLMSSVKDNLQRVEFAFIPNLGLFEFVEKQTKWKLYSLSLLLSPYFGLQINREIPESGTILDSARQMKTVGDKVHFIYQRVKDHIKWDENQSFYADDLVEVWKNRSGNSAEINLSILNLLKKAGVESYPILVSTRDNGKPDLNFMTMGQFDGVDVIVIDSNNYYVLDGIQKNLSYKIPPYNILNRDVFLVDTLNSKWVNITETRPLIKNTISVKAQISENGQMKGDAYISYFDHYKAMKLAEDEEDRLKSQEEINEESKEFIERESPDISIDSLIEKNADEELLPLNHIIKFTYQLSDASDYYFIDPFFFSNFRKNPFTDSLRRTDIDMGSNQSYSLSLHITIAPGLVAEEIPKNILLRTEDSSMLFKRVIFHQDNVIVFRHNFEILRAYYSKEENLMLRDFFSKIYDIVSEQIILKKR